MKSFSIELSEKNEKWCKENLDDRDYVVTNSKIKIKYYTQFQKDDIINSLTN